MGIGTLMYFKVGNFAQLVGALLMYSLYCWRLGALFQGPGFESHWSVSSDSLHILMEQVEAYLNQSICHIIYHIMVISMLCHPHHFHQDSVSTYHTHSLHLLHQDIKCITILLVCCGKSDLPLGMYGVYLHVTHNATVSWFLWTLGNFPLKPGHRLSPSFRAGHGSFPPLKCLCSFE